MPVISIDGIGDVTITEKKLAKRLILRVKSNGLIQLTTPNRTSQRSAVQFILKQQEWIADQMEAKQSIKDDDMIAHRYVIQFVAEDRTKPRYSTPGDRLMIFHSDKFESNDKSVQIYTAKTIKSVLKKEALKFLPDRLEQLSRDTGLSYANLNIKHLKSRWGSCNNRQVLTLNSLLMNLPHHMIDHVILHELTHTRHMNHGQEFWNLLSEMDEFCQNHKKQLKTFDANSLVMA